MGQKLYLIYDPNIVHEMTIDEIIKVCADCGHSPVDPANYIPKYHPELWTPVDIEKVQYEAMSRCEGVVVCDNTEFSDNWLRCAERMQMDIYTVWNVKKWERNIEI